MNKFDEKLKSGIASALIKAEDNGDIVTTTATPNDIYTLIANNVKEVYAGGVLSPDELFGICVVMFHAVENEKFYDWEMPTLCGYTREEMKILVKKLRDSLNV